MSLDFTGAWAVPGLETIRENTENVVWFGKFDQQVLLPAVIDSASLDADNTGATDVIRQGTVLGMVTSSKKLKPWNPTATTGEENIYGVLLNEVKMQYSGTARDRFVGWVLVKGNLKASGIRIPNVVGTSTALLSAGTSIYEPLFRSLATQNGQFIIDDRPSGSMLGWSRLVDLASLHASAYTVVEADNGTLFHSRSVVGNYTITMPSAALLIGCRVGFAVCGSALTHDFTINFTANQLLTFNDIDADSIAFTGDTTAVGSVVEFIALNASFWLSIPHVWPGNVVTIGT